VAVGGRDHLGAGGVDLGVDGEGRPVDRLVAVDDLAGGIDLDEVGDRDVAEVHGEGVDPEGLGVLGVPGGDVAGHALLEAEQGEEPQGGGQALLAVEALLGRVFVGARRGRGEKARHEALLEVAARDPAYGRNGPAALSDSGSV
jgi:hypothetical protein